MDAASRRGCSPLSPPMMEVHLPGDGADGGSGHGGCDGLGREMRPFCWRLWTMKGAAGGRDNDRNVRREGNW